MILNSIFVKRFLSTFLLVAFLSIPITFGNFFSPVKSVALVTPSSGLNISQLIIDGEIDKAIPLLENELAQSRKDKDRFHEAKVLSQLQFSYYCQGALRRSLVTGQDLSEILTDLFKKGVSTPQITSLIADNVALYMHTEIERGETEKIVERLDELLQYQKTDADTKTKAKILLGLMYGTHLNRNKNLYEKSFKEFESISSVMNSLHSADDIQLVFQYIDTIKLIKSDEKQYLLGIKSIEKIKQQYKKDFPVIVAYAELKIASLYQIGKDLGKSSFLLENNYQRINQLPGIFRYMTWDILGDNAFAEKKYSLAAKYYLELTRNLDYIMRRNGGSDSIHGQIFKTVATKIARNNSFLERRFSKEGIFTILARAIGEEPGTYKDIQNIIDKLNHDSFTIQKELLDRDLLWDAFTVSEITRTQLTKRTLGIASFLRDDNSTKIVNPATLALSYQVAGKESLFPISALNLASSFQSQNFFNLNNEYKDKSHIVRTTESTIVEYSYDFKDTHPKEIYVYILKPEIDMRKMKPIVRCISLDPIEISPVCGKYLHKKLSSNTDKNTILNVEFKKYVSDHVTNVVNCRRMETSLQDGCNIDSVSKSLQLLYQLLIEPISDLLPINSSEKVIFIPHGNLFSIPFTALQDPQGKYLIEKHTLSIAPSLTVLGKATSLYLDKSHGLAKEILVIGNPSLSKNLSLPSLPFAENEAQAIGQIYRIKPLIGGEATKDAVVNKFSKARIVHIAAHGLINGENSLENSIVLSPTGNNLDGRMLAKDIPTNTAELVVLSACRSGKGNISTDGVGGFSTQLISSGNPSQIVSLWSVSDESTTQIMVDFHHDLHGGESKIYALRKAMLKAMKTSNYSEPYYWAPFILSGNTQ
jgi:CHAT domain-containing protein